MVYFNMGLHNYKKPEKYIVDAQVKEIGSEYALLETSPGITFKWPISKLPSKTKVTDLVKVKLITEETEKEENYEQMRSLLNEIVN